MRARVVLGWTGFAPFVILIGSALYVNFTGVSAYLTAYPLERLSQALSGISFTAPLLSGYCALNAARLKAVVLRPVARGHVLSLAVLLGPAVIASLLMTVAFGVVVEPPRGLVSWILLGLVGAVYCGSALFGAALGLATHISIGAPLSILVAFGWFAMPIGTGINWLRTSNTASLLGSCCTPEQQYQTSSLVTSAAVSAVLITGFGIGVACRSQPRRFAAVAATTCAVLSLSLAVGQSNSFDGLATRKDEPVCNDSSGQQVCVWPENQDRAAAQGEAIAEVTEALRMVSSRFPESWSESATFPVGAASTTASSRMDLDTRRISTLIALAQWWGCGRDASASVIVGGALLLGVDESVLNRPDLEEIKDQVASLHRDQLIRWLGAILREGCPGA